MLERPYDPATDFQVLRAFLLARARDVPPSGLWDARMADGAYAGPVDADVLVRTRMFEAPPGRLAGALLSQGDAEIHPQLHPTSRRFESHLIARGEAIGRELGDEHARVLCWADDEFRRSLLRHAGYEATERWCSVYRRPLDADLAPEATWPAGYSLRTTRATDDEALAVLLNRAFERTRHTSHEVRRFRGHAPSFRPELDLVAEASDGSLAAYVAVAWIDGRTPSQLEPVCTAPHHRRRGLARALILEAMQRAAAKGATALEVGTNDAPAAHALYHAVGFEEIRRGTFWRKDLDRSSG